MKFIQLADACVCCGASDLASSPAVLMPFVASRTLGQEPLEISASWGMRDLKPGMAYTLCHSLQCRACECLFLNYRFTPAQMTSLYSGYRGPAYTHQRDTFEPGYAASAARDFSGRRPYIARVEAWLAPFLTERPKILDWGGGDGSNTPFLGKGQVFIYDISGAAPVQGAEHADTNSPADYDLLVCMQVLEHVAEPLAVLHEIVPLLNSRSLMYLEVPHEALMRKHPPGTNLTPHKRHWHEHVNFFTEASLRRLTERAGLQVKETLRLPVGNGEHQSEVLGLLLQKGNRP